MKKKKRKNKAMYIPGLPANLSVFADNTHNDNVVKCKLEGLLLLYCLKYNTDLISELRSCKHAENITFLSLN